MVKSAEFSGGRIIDDITVCSRAVRVELRSREDNNVGVEGRPFRFRAELPRLQLEGACSCGERNSSAACCGTRQCSKDEMAGEATAT